MERNGERVVTVERMKREVITRRRREKIFKSILIFFNEECKFHQSDCRIFHCIPRSIDFVADIFIFLAL